MIETFYGREEVSIGILIDQAGSYLVLSTVGIVVATLYSVGKTSAASVAKKVLLFPPFQALMLVLLLRPFAYPVGMTTVLERLGGTLAPLALFSVGFQLRVGDLQGRKWMLALGLLFKLIVGPALLLLLFAGGLSARGHLLQVTIFEAAMGPQIGGAIVAMDHHLDPPLVTLMVGLGIPLSFLTLPLWWYILQGFAGTH